jgi:hypothetical protein
MRAKLPALVVLLLLASAFGGCGGSASTTEEEGPRVSPLEVSGGGSAQFRVEGADNSIANYGAEADGRELRQAATVAHGYLAALATEDWAGACARFSQEEAGKIEQLAASHPEFRGKGCVSALAELIGAVSPADAREATVVDAVGLRWEGEQGFLIYRGARGKPYFLSLAREGGSWAVDGLSPSALG